MREGPYGRATWEGPLRTRRSRSNTVGPAEVVVSYTSARSHAQLYTLLLCRTRRTPTSQYPPKLYRFPPSLNTAWKGRGQGSRGRGGPAGRWICTAFPFPNHCLEGSGARGPKRRGVRGGDLYAFPFPDGCKDRLGARGAKGKGSGAGKEGEKEEGHKPLCRHPGTANSERK
jgi:hypothetical protein